LCGSECLCLPTAPWVAELETRFESMRGPRTIATNFFLPWAYVMIGPFHRLLWICLLVLIIHPHCAEAVPPYAGTVWISPSVITEADPSSFAQSTYLGQAPRTVFDRRCACWITMNAYIFQARFTDGGMMEMQVNPEFGSAGAAAIWATKYAMEIGRLPAGLRRSVDACWIHAGSQPFGGGNRSILVHTEMGQTYESSGFLEEVLFHEATHTSMDGQFASSAVWLNARTADPDFLSTYAAQNPMTEDVSETTLPYFALRYKPSTLTAADRQIIAGTVPGRIGVLDDRADLFADRTLVGWGDGSNGNPTPPIIADACTQIAAHAFHSLALRTNGDVIAWGYNGSGQCNVPANLGPCQMVTAGEAVSGAVKSTGQVVVWGSNASGQLNVPTTLGACTMLSLGYGHAVALKTSGAVAAWGSNTSGQATVPATLGSCIRVTAGSFHTLALRANGTVAAWGLNDSSQSTVPASVGICSRIAAGWRHSLALRANGTVAVWGWNNAGQLNVPATLTEVVEIASGYEHCVALHSSGAVSCWGGNTAGQSTLPRPLGAAVQIAAGGWHTLVRQVPLHGCTSDLNLDGSVNAADLAVVLSRWGAAGPLADLNLDGTVNAADLAVVLANWGSCPN
jgi:hypothetical protein